MSEARFVEAAGVRLRAVIDGAASSQPPPLLVLHGFTGAAESMQDVATAFAPTRRVARLELVGHGGSEAPDDLDRYAMTACCEQIREASRALGLSRPVLIGYSMGGRAALACAAEHPEAFSGLVLIGATAGIADPAARRERIAADEALADRLERDGLEAFVDAWMAMPLFVSQQRLGPEALTRARQQRLRNRPRGLAHSLRGMGAGTQPPLHDRLARVDLPVLLVVGEEDAKFRAIAAELAVALPRASVAVLDEAGHAAHLEAPADFAERVAQFLDTLGPRASCKDPGDRR